MTTETHPGELLDRVQDLTAQVDALADGPARVLAQELLSTVIAMYGDGLSRIMAVIEGSGAARDNILDELAQDGAVASLLLIHDLYPVPLSERVIEALDTVRPYMESHGGNVELVGIEDGVARLVLQGSCNGCAASRATLELAIKQALDEHAPDLAGLDVQGVNAEPAALGGAGTGAALPMAEPASTTSKGFELPLVHSGASAPTEAERQPRWVPVAEAQRPGPGSLTAVDVDGVALLLAEVDGALLAYGNECAACGEQLSQARLQDGLLRCPECEVEFDLPRAGRAAGGEPLQLRPIPLLEAGGVRVAV